MSELRPEPHQKRRSPHGWNMDTDFVFQTVYGLSYRTNEWLRWFPWKLRRDTAVQSRIIHEGVAIKKKGAWRNGRMRIEAPQGDEISQSRNATRKKKKQKYRADLKNRNPTIERGDHRGVIGNAIRRFIQFKNICKEYTVKGSKSQRSRKNLLLLGPSQQHKDNDMNWR